MRNHNPVYLTKLKMLEQMRLPGFICQLGWIFDLCFLDLGKFVYKSLAKRTQLYEILLKFGMPQLIRQLEE